MAVSKRYVEIALDKPRRIRFTLNAIREVEQDFGIGFNEIFDKDKPLIGMDAIVRLLFYGLKHGDRENRKDLTSVDKLGDILQKHWVDADKGNWADLMEYVVDGMKAGGIIPKDTELDIEEVDLDNDPLVEDQKLVPGETGKTA